MTFLPLSRFLGSKLDVQIASFSQFWRQPLPPLTGCRCIGAFGSSFLTCHSSPNFWWQQAIAGDLTDKEDQCYPASGVGVLATSRGLSWSDSVGSFFLPRVRNPSWSNRTGTCPIYLMCVQGAHSIKFSCKNYKNIQSKLRFAFASCNHTHLRHRSEDALKIYHFGILAVIIVLLYQPVLKDVLFVLISIGRTHQTIEDFPVNVAGFNPRFGILRGHGFGHGKS
jgi:hypothetical protein